MIFGIKHSLCLTSIVSKAHPSLSMPIKKSLVFAKLRRGDCGSIGAVMRGSTWIAGGEVGMALTLGAVVYRKMLVKHEFSKESLGRRRYKNLSESYSPGSGLSSI